MVRSLVSCAALAAALTMGVSAAHAQTRQYDGYCYVRSGDMNANTSTDQDGVARSGAPCMNGEYYAYTDGYRAAPRAPDAWSPAAKAKFAMLDPEVQAEIARREAEVHKGFTKQDEQRNLGKSIEQAYAPYMAMVRAEGGDPVRTTQVLLQTAYTLRHGTPEQKEHLVLGLMQQYAVDPNRVFQRLAGGQQTQQVHPQVAQLQAQVERLQRAEQERMQSTQSQEQAQIGQAIERFASDPKNVYFANVRNDMGSLMDSASKQGRELSLQEAYDMACWARPDIRPLLQQQIDLQRVADAQAKAKKARAAGSSLTGSPSGSSSAAAAAKSTGTLEDDLRATWREVMGRE